MPDASEPARAMTVDTMDRADAPAEGVWAPSRRRLTAGLVLTVTLVAFESLAVSTVMPVIKDELGGLGLYGWVFSGFYLGMLLGIVVAGQLADAYGTRFPFVMGLVAFCTGLVIGAAAQSMGMLVAGRVVQGFGVGVVPAVAYVSVGRVYPPELRPRVFAVFSTAWVVPSLVGPAAGSALAEAFSWRAVFGALLPLVAVAAWMTLPALTNGMAEPSDAVADKGGRSGTRIGLALLLVLGAGAVLAGTTVSVPILAVALVVVGLPPAIWAFVRLVPPGTVRLAAGLPAAIAARGILTFAFFGADVYVPLELKDVRDQSTFMAGAALTAATLAWTAGSWINQKVVTTVGPRWLVRRGFLCIALGIGGMLLVLSAVPAWMALPFWAVAGLGMGLAFSPLTVTVLDAAEPGNEGEATAALQLSDVLGSSISVGLGGAFVALGESRDWDVGASLVPVFVLMLVVAVGGFAAAGRLPRTLRSS